MLVKRYEYQAPSPQQMEQSYRCENRSVVREEEGHFTCAIPTSLSSTIHALAAPPS